MAFDPYELDRDYGAPSGVITEAQYTTRTFLWMMLGLMVTFGVALVGWMTNAQLLRQLELLRTGDTDAFEQIYIHLSQPLFTVIVRIMGNRTAAEDILQEVFVKLYQSPPPPSVKNPRAYLFQMARNLAIDGIRGQHQSVSLGRWNSSLFPQRTPIWLWMWHPPWPPFPKASAKWSLSTWTAV